MPLVMGIDPGKNGAIVVIGGYPIISRIPSDPSDLREVFKEMPHVERVYIESVSTAHWGGAVSNSSLSKCYGALLVALDEFKKSAKCRGIVTVHSRTWQKELKLNTPPPKPVGSMNEKEASKWYRFKKNRNKALAERLFTDVKVSLWNADALLIAYYGQRDIKKGNI